MSITRLLDTSVYSQPIRKKPLTTVQTRWEELGESRLCISVICLAEVLQGLKLRGSKSLWTAYRELLAHRFRVLAVDDAVADIYSTLAVESRKSGKTRPQFDLLIAATAVNYRLILATCNARDFQEID